VPGSAQSPDDLQGVGIDLVRGEFVFFCGVNLGLFCGGTIFGGLISNEQ